MENRGKLYLSIDKQSRNGFSFTNYTISRIGKRSVNCYPIDTPDIGITMVRLFVLSKELTVQSIFIENSNNQKIRKYVDWNEPPYKTLAKIDFDTENLVFITHDPIQ